jgi:hypothetical protein
MKKFNDTKIYLYTALGTLLAAVLMGMVSYYSILFVEPEVQALLAAQEGESENFSRAYVILRDPQLFARYENFDGMGQSIRVILKDFDKRMIAGEKFDRDDRIYLEVLLDRRARGSAMGRNTMVFFLVISLMAWGYYFYERRSTRDQV